MIVNIYDSRNAHENMRLNEMNSTATRLNKMLFNQNLNCFCFLTTFGYLRVLKYEV